ncbi:hypothetical protein GGF32_006123 [Allomyces javanicus]|nr:hypothetical protein GGF32_006123 [Allomyces javanicus]
MLQSAFPVAPSCSASAVPETTAKSRRARAALENLPSLILEDVCEWLRDGRSDSRSVLEFALAAPTLFAPAVRVAIRHATNLVVLALPHDATTIVTEHCLSDIGGMGFGLPHVPDIRADAVRRMYLILPPRDRDRARVNSTVTFACTHWSVVPVPIEQVTHAMWMNDMALYRIPPRCRTLNLRDFVFNERLVVPQPVVAKLLATRKLPLSLAELIAKGPSFGQSTARALASVLPTLPALASLQIGTFQVVDVLRIAQALPRAGMRTIRLELLMETARDAAAVKKLAAELPELLDTLTVVVRASPSRLMRPRFPPSPPMYAMNIMNVDSGDGYYPDYGDDYGYGYDYYHESGEEDYDAYGEYFDKGALSGSEGNSNGSSGGDSSSSSGSNDSDWEDYDELDEDDDDFDLVRPLCTLVTHLPAVRDLTLDVPCWAPSLLANMTLSPTTTHLALHEQDQVVRSPPDFLRTLAPRLPRDLVALDLSTCGPFQFVDLATALFPAVPVLETLILRGACADVTGQHAWSPHFRHLDLSSNRIRIVEALPPNLLFLGLAGPDMFAHMGELIGWVNLVPKTIRAIELPCGEQTKCDICVKLVERAQDRDTWPKWRVELRCRKGFGEWAPEWREKVLERFVLVESKEE